MKLLADILKKYEYYRTDLGVLYHADCLQIMPHLEPVDLVLTDPQYGINHPTDYKDRGRGALAECKNYLPVRGDDKPFDPKPILELNKPTVLWGANHFCSRVPDSSGWLVWDKLRPDTLDQATCELAWTNFVKGVRRFKYLWNGMIRESKETIFHPTQKPLALILWVFSLPWTPPGTTLDPYAGSCTTAVACERLKRKWVCIEIEEYYCKESKQRIENERKQRKLF